MLSVILHNANVVTVVILIVLMLSDVVLSVVMLIGVRLSVMTHNVVAPCSLMSRW
jgi:hypothetical protein